MLLRHPKIERLKKHRVVGPRKKNGVFPLRGEIVQVTKRKRSQAGYPTEAAEYLEIRRKLW